MRRRITCPLDPDRDEAAWLVDWNGKLLKTVNTHSRNTSGMAYGNGCVWMGANADPYGIFQVDHELQANHPPADSAQHRRQRRWLPWREVAQRQALDCRAAPGRHPARRSDDVGSRSPDPRELGEKPRLHDVAFDNEGNIWVVTGNNSTSYAEGKAGLNKYDGKTGQLLMTVDFRARIVRPARAGVARRTTHQLRCRHPPGMEGHGEPAQRLHLQHRDRLTRAVKRSGGTPVTSKIWARRSLMSGMSAVAAGLVMGARRASAQTAAAAFQPVRHQQDEWLDKIPGNTGVVFDVTSFRGVPEALHFASNIYLGNKSLYGLDEADAALLIILRHGATAFGYADAIWAKHGKALTEATGYTDRSGESPRGNPFNATRIETINEMAKRGVQFGVCDTASHNLARRLAGAGGDADAIYKEMVASMIPSSRLVVVGVIGVTRAQEYGYSVVHAG